MKLEVAAWGSANYTDLTPYIKNQGVKWSFNSVDADGAGRTLDGNMQRKQIGIKKKLEIECIPIPTSVIDMITNLLANEWLSVKLTTATETHTWRMYAGATINMAILRSWDGLEDWGGFSFSLIER